MSRGMPNDTLWEYYQHFINMKAQKKSIELYSNENNVSLNALTAFKYAFVFKKEKNPERYKHLMALVKKYNEIKSLNGKTNYKKFLSQYCPEQLKNEGEFSATVRHVNMLERINKLKAEHEMQFYEVSGSETDKTDKTDKTENSNGNLVHILPRQSDVISPKNDLTIKIAKGINITISSDMPNCDIIKIINFIREF